MRKRISHSSLGDWEDAEDALLFLPVLLRQQRSLLTSHQQLSCSVPLVTVMSLHPSMTLLVLCPDTWNCLEFTAPAFPFPHANIVSVTLDTLSFRNYKCAKQSPLTFNIILFFCQ